MIGIKRGGGLGWKNDRGGGRKTKNTGGRGDEIISCARNSISWEGDSNIMETK